MLTSFSNDGFMCIMTIEGRIKDCWFLGEKKSNVFRYDYLLMDYPKKMDGLGEVTIYSHNR